MDSIPSFIKLIEKSIGNHWESPAFSDFRGDTFAYKDVAEYVERLHIIYAEMGLKRGDRIALCASNSSRWGIVFISALTYGAVPVPILNDFTAGQIQYIATHSESCLLFVSGQIYKQIDEAEMPLLKGILKMEDYSLLLSRDEQLTTVCSCLDDLFIKMYPQGLASEMIRYDRETAPDELAMINYTSGTTGFSKGVMIPYRALWSNSDFAQSILCKMMKKGDRIISLLPMAHMYGMMFEFIAEFIFGCQVTFFTKTPSPTLLSKAFMDIRPRAVVAVPLIIEKMVRKMIMPQLQKSGVMKYMKWPLVGYLIRKIIRKKVQAAFGGRMYQVIVGGAAINQNVESFLHDILFPIAVGYGATECAPIICYEDWKHLLPGSCGKAVSHMEVKIESTDPQKIPGEILTKGMNVMLGYYKNEEATHCVLDKNGWYHTGDLGVIDKQGNVFIKGRIKNMLLGPNGQNIYPEEIEDKLNSMLMVSESIVIKCDDRLIALIHPDYDEARQLNLDDDNIKHIMQMNRIDLNEMVSAYERIQQIEIYKDEFEKTPKKSIKRYLYDTCQKNDRKS